ncbi:Hypothetical predicted protein [Podarcis lilfordi]|uniref:Uncharacterized protein n=1 Tax=Podarcis lilfordi TaxID=74358 RepID=A0AA35KHV7_9SAUR|nr:Hypothetical predicted protein [Podarcis lilfordi]
MGRLCWRTNSGTSWGVNKECQAADLRGLRTLKCSKQETAQAILDILGPLENFRDGPLTLALEALIQLSIMTPKFSGDMLSAILHRTLEAVLGGPQKEEDREVCPLSGLPFARLFLLHTHMQHQNQCGVVVKSGRLIIWGTE